MFSEEFIQEMLRIAKPLVIKELIKELMEENKHLRKEIEKIKIGQTMPVV